MNSKVELLRWIISCLKVFRDRKGDSEIALKGYAKFIASYLADLIDKSKNGVAKKIFAKSHEILIRINKHRKLTQPVFSEILQKVINDLDECLEKARKN